VVAVKIRLPGLPDEIGQAVSILTGTPALDVIEVSSPYPDRGGSRIVRACIEDRFRADGRADP
jgi:hypothetical protein